MGNTASTLLTVSGYFLLVALGALVGSRRAVRNQTVSWLSPLQTVLLLMIILALGIQLGANEEVAASLGVIGFSALVIALSAMAGSVLLLTCLRVFVLRLNRVALPRGAKQEQTAGEEMRTDGSLTWQITAAVIFGFELGHWILPSEAAPLCGKVVTLGLDAMLFLVGLDLGRQGEAIASIRAAGVGALLIPAAVIFGSLLFGALAGLFLPLLPREAAAAAAGMGWYSLAPTILAPYSLKLSAVAFLSNVLREILSILLIPMIARRLGYLECVASAGATAMDTVLPVIVRATSRRMTIYAFASGLICSLLVPLLVPLIAGI